jgi:MFS family permease
MLPVTALILSAQLPSYPQAIGAVLFGRAVCGRCRRPVGGVFSDQILRRTGKTRMARVSVIVIGFLGSFIFMMPVLLIHNLVVIAICLSAAFFAPTSADEPHQLHTWDSKRRTKLPIWAAKAREYKSARRAADAVTSSVLPARGDSGPEDLAPTDVADRPSAGNER